MASIKTMLALTASVAASAWMAVGPAVAGGVDMFEFNNGVKTKDVLNIALGPGEVAQGNAFTCGRCFCLLLTSNPSIRTSYLYNASFCLVPTPKVESKVSIPYLAYNLHSNLGEGDGGNAYTVLVDHTVTPQAFIIAAVAGGTVDKLADISAFVNNANGEQGTVHPGGTAFCADTATMWVGIDARGGDKDVMLTVDLATGNVTAALDLNMPVLAAHVGVCKASPQLVGGVIVTSAGPGRHAIVAGTISPVDGSFLPADAADLPADDVDASPVAAFLDYTAFSSPVVAFLYNAAGQGLQFTSTPGGARGSATLTPLAAGLTITGVAVEY